MNIHNNSLYRISEIVFLLIIVSGVYFDSQWMILAASILMFVFSYVERFEHQKNENEESKKLSFYARLARDHRVKKHHEY
ncbi:MAG: hypothetical protein HRU24_13310 [Gammaproteobacteria bacterium]|nr:hypothetical protein [Gammaproteobacteria bacterium]NRA71994.1 hypothetical protein [Gammaproteobacteria bacterium]